MAKEQVQENSGNGKKDRESGIREKYGDRVGYLRVEGFFDQFTLCMGPLETAIDKLGNVDERMGEAAIMYAAYRHAYDSLREMIETLEKKFDQLVLVLEPDHTLFYHGFKSGDVRGIEVWEPASQQAEQEQPTAGTVVLPKSETRTDQGNQKTPVQEQPEFKEAMMGLSYLVSAIRKFAHDMRDDDSEGMAHVLARQANQVFEQFANIAGDSGK
ncbi:MAG: hypothetical protein K9K64_10015 [Desulfohalobiaceae bacterium]|nr:hypothetical protein [Desulfohalobiaceae bacterium]